MGKKRCSHCNAVIMDGAEKCLACGSTDFYDEDERKREEEREERISKWKNMPKGKKIGIIFAIIGVFVFFIIIGYVSPAKETGIETSCYLTETCFTSSGVEITIDSTSEYHAYVAEDGVKSVDSPYKIITLFGNIFNNLEKKENFSKGMFRLELSNGKEITPINCTFFGNNVTLWDRATLFSKSGCEIMIDYKVDESIKIEDCRLIYYSNAIALVKR